MDDIQKRLASSKVLATVGEIEKRKEAARILPTHALFRDLKNATHLSEEDLSEVLDDLQAREYVEVGRTINDNYVRLKK